MIYYAHTHLDSEEAWEPLERHHDAVSSLAARFARSFDSEGWGKTAGQWHDLGKYREAFQRRLRGENIRAEHAIVGACWATELLGEKLGYPLAFAIAGHHAGLANHIDAKDTGQTALKDRLRDGLRLLDEVRPSIPALPSRENLALPAMACAPSGLAFWTRMLFSALVDADYLATEEFMDPERAATRPAPVPLDALRGRLDARLDALAKGLDPEKRASTVNQARAEILAHCRAAAVHPPGVFSLTVPTGGGKTLSSMAFALDHAVRHGLRRVIVVLPYTTIIEQNADAIGKAIGHEHVLEHHATLTRAERAAKLDAETTAQHERAEENWDAPVVVTTTVQFFESLFANRPGRCRKLHNIARSVIILDEAQALPRPFLLPILDALNHLARDYGCTLLLSTATPPALEKRKTLPAGFSGVRQILPDVNRHYRALERVRYHWPDERVTEWPDLADAMAKHPRALAVVHKRRDARDLAELLAAKTGERVWHLSALMCPAHRKEVIAEIRAALNESRPCRVVSTQLIEAGVDLDFPVVYRALAGLDSIVQAAGRCNREGRLEKGEVHVFRAPTSPPRGILNQALEVSETMLKEYPELDPNDPAIFDQFFRELYFSQNKMDLRHIRRHIEEMNFASVAANFHLIDDAGQMSVVCPFGDAEKRLREFRLAHAQQRLGRDQFRALQPFIVTVHGRETEQLVRDGVLEPVLPDSDANLWELSAPYATSKSNAYTMEYGLALQDAMADPEALIEG